MKKIWDWFKDSHRYQHFLGGMLIGACSNNWYCAIYIGVGVGGALEFKDKSWGGKWDWIDFALTFSGAVVGYGMRWIIFG